MAYAVLAETKDGNVLTLRRGFVCRDDAEDHPVQLSLWKRVWVEKEVTAPVAEACLPPKPWDWVASGAAVANGTFHAYLVDATGRKIGAIWGKGREKELVADHILECCNGRDDDDFGLPERLARPLRGYAERENTTARAIISEAVSGYLGLSA
jgi:hypothetical protein